MVKNGRIKDSAKKEASKDIYEEVITTHINADFDALASMIAARKLYPEAALVFPGSQEKNLRNFFLQSTSYIFDFKKIKQLNLESIKKLILVDTRQRSRIGRFSEVINRKDVDVHIYDHHPESDDDIRGSFELIKKVGSNTAILTSLIRERGIPVSVDEATIMCLGIHEDTGSFTFSSTTAEDYKAAAWLTEQGADHNLIADMLTRELTAEQVWVLNDLTQAATTRVINGVEVVITKVIRDDYVGDFAVLVHKLMEMENLNVLFALGQMEDRIHVVARSRIDEVNVAEIALALGGGGHPQAASATVKNKTLMQLERSLLALLRNSIRPIKKAGDMMVSPVINVSPEDTLKKATNLLTRYNINVLMVINGQGVLNGYISRQVVEKAVYFGLELLKVKEYMNIEFSIVRPEASLREVQELIIRNKMRILPVVEKGVVVGVITRTDLLNILLGDPVIPEFLYDFKTDSQLARKKNMATLLKERLPRKLIRLIKAFGNIGDMLGTKVYLVGGIVRDVMLKKENLDVDIVVEKDGILFAHEFARQHEVRVRSHRKFGTAVLIFPDGFKIDVATARMEYYESPGAPPVVESSSLKMDLYRRDFTINTLAIRLNKREYGTLIDYFGAQKDIKERVLRVLHNLSFVEDPSRVFRAIRFENRFGFKIGKLTLALIKNAVRINTFKDVSGRRLLLELRLILNEENQLSAIDRMHQLDLLQVISPRIRFTETLRLLLEEIEKVIGWYKLLFLEEPVESWQVYWHGITSQVEPGHLKEIFEKMDFIDKDGIRILNQRKAVTRLWDELFRYKGDNYLLYTLLSPYDTELLLYLMAKAQSEKVRRLISKYFTQLKGTKVSMNGKDLLSMGIKPGPIFKQVFERLLQARMNGLLKSKDDEIDFVHENFKEKIADQHQ